MPTSNLELSVKGKLVTVPAIYVDGKPVIVTGRFVKTAGIFDEEWANDSAIENVDQFVSKLKAQGVRADLFTFTELFNHRNLNSGYFIESDNLAVIPTTSYKQ